MPLPGKRWRHVVLGTYNSWLPGDPRGFRTRHHKLHSSGDYKQPPPAGEHAGLHDYSRRISAPAVVIPAPHRQPAGLAMVRTLAHLQHRLLALSISGMHAHLLAELPEDMTRIRAILGQCKSSASHAIRDALPGRVWAAGGKFKTVDTDDHARQILRYILDHIHEGAWVWSFQEGMPEEAVDPRTPPETPLETPPGLA